MRRNLRSAIGHTGRRTARERSAAWAGHISVTAGAINPVRTGCSVQACRSSPSVETLAITSESFCV